MCRVCVCGEGGGGGGCFIGGGGGGGSGEGGKGGGGGGGACFICVDVGVCRHVHACMRVGVLGRSLKTWFLSKQNVYFPSKSISTIITKQLCLF